MADAVLDPESTGSRPGAWRRVLLKVSGEAFAGEDGYGIDGAVVRRIAKDIVDVRRDLEVDVAIVVGGGNIWRGMSCLLYTSPSPRDRTRSRMPSSA